MTTLKSGCTKFARLSRKNNTKDTSATGFESAPDADEASDVAFGWPPRAGSVYLNGTHFDMLTW